MKLAMTPSVLFVHVYHMEMVRPTHITLTVTFIKSQLPGLSNIMDYITMILRKTRYFVNPETLHLPTNKYIQSKTCHKKTQHLTILVYLKGLIQHTRLITYHCNRKAPPPNIEMSPRVLLWDRERCFDQNMTTVNHVQSH